MRERDILITERKMLVIDGQIYGIENRWEGGAHDDRTDEGKKGRTGAYE